MSTRKQQQLAAPRARAAPTLKSNLRRAPKADSGVDIDLLFHALGDPTRRAMLDRLTHGPMSVSALADPLGITLTAVAQHLQILEESAPKSWAACAPAALSRPVSTPWSVGLRITGPSGSSNSTASACSSTNQMTSSRQDSSSRSQTQKGWIHPVNPPLRLTVRSAD